MAECRQHSGVMTCHLCGRPGANAAASEKIARAKLVAYQNNDDIEALLADARRGTDARMVSAKI